MVHLCTPTDPRARVFAWGKSRTSPSCPWLLMLPQMCWCPALKYALKWSAFFSTSDSLTGHWHETSPWYPWNPSGLAEPQAERGSGTAAYHRALEHSPYTHRQLRSKFNINWFICCGFFLPFLSAMVWLHTVNENCCMQRALFCYRLNSRSLAGFWKKPEVVAVISFLLENFPFP